MYPWTIIDMFIDTFLDALIEEEQEKARVQREARSMRKVLEKELKTHLLVDGFNRLNQTNHTTVHKTYDNAITVIIDVSLFTDERLVEVIDEYEDEILDNVRSAFRYRAGHAEQLIANKKKRHDWLKRNKE